MGNNPSIDDQYVEIGSGNLPWCSIIDSKSGLEGTTMNQNEKQKILVAGGIGAIIGGIVVAAVTRAIPKMMEEISATMMGKMMARMGEEGCTPEEMWAEMMKGFVEAQNN